MAINHRSDGGEKRLPVLNELLGVLRALAIQIVDQIRVVDLFGGILGHLLQNALGKIDCGFVGHSFTEWWIAGPGLRSP